METSSPEFASPALQVRLFGSFELAIDGQVIAIPRVASQVIALLCLAPGNRFERTSLAGRLWPDAPHERALFYLRRALLQTRESIGDYRVRNVAGGSIALDLDGAWCDVVEFDSLVSPSGGDRLERAVELYRGDLLSSWDSAWVSAERAQRSAAYVEVLERLAGQCATNGDERGAARLLKDALHVEPFREPLYHAFMDMLARLGDAAGIEREYRKLRRLLRDELNTGPSSQTELAYRQAIEKAAAPVGGPPASSASKPLVKLPWQATSLIGREADVETLGAASDYHRLLTLTGPGGVGKTRLAVAVAESRRSVYREGIAFVDLSSIPTGSLAAGALATAIGVRPALDALPLDTVCGWLADKRFLLILDNCEHILEGVNSVIQTLLSRCPFVHLLCTSRLQLGCPGEHAQHVSPLTIPPEDTPQIAHYPSVKVFVERSMEVNPRFKLTAANAVHVAKICRAVDGLPLGIELAAAHVRHLSVAELTARLDARQIGLSRRSANTARHRSLTSAIEWSYQLVDEGQQRLLRHMSVFRGSFSLDTATSVCRSAEYGDDGIARDFAGLVAHNLVTPANTGVNRYRLLEAVRHYAHERLVERNEDHNACSRHAARFAWMARAVEPRLLRQEAGLWAERIDMDLANVREAFQWLTTQPEDKLAQRALLMMARLLRYWIARGEVRYARETLDRLLNNVGTQHTLATRRATVALAWLYFTSARYKDAVLHYRKALSLAREANDTDTEWKALSGLGASFHEQAMYQRAEIVYRRALAIAEARGSEDGLAAVTSNLGHNARWMGRFEEAADWYRRSADLADANDLVRVATFSRLGLGHILHRQGDFTEATRLFGHIVATAREMTDNNMLWYGLILSAAISNDVGKLESAEELLNESLVLARQSDSPDRVATALLYLTANKILKGDWSAARQYCLESLYADPETTDLRILYSHSVVAARIAAQFGHRETAALLLSCASSLGGIAGDVKWVTANLYEETKQLIEDLWVEPSTDSSPSALNLSQTASQIRTAIHSLAANQ